jgi:enoyl-CoA hydratase
MLTVERRGAVATISYHHPPRNFMTARSLRELRLVFRALERDPSVRVIVFTGAADGHYMLHLDVDELGTLLSQTPRAFVRPLLWLARAAFALLRVSPRLADAVLDASVRSAMLNMMLLFDAVERSRKITIAAINGPCIGGGLELSLCFDYRLMRDDATHRIGLPEILIGMIPGFGGTRRLRRLLGVHRARELLLAGELLSPAGALQAGVISRLLPAHAFAAEVAAFADRSSRRSPAAVAALKRALTDGNELAAAASLSHDPLMLANLHAYRGHLSRALADPAPPTISELVARIE